MSSYIAVTSGGVRWKVLADFKLIFEFGAFADIEKLLKRATLLRELRATSTYEVPVVDLIFWLKVYKPAGALGRLFGAFSASGAQREMDNCLGAMRRGVQVVALTGAGECGAGSYVVSQALDGWTTLQESLLYNDVQGKERRAMMFQFGQWARQIHDSGVYQESLDPAHIMVKTWGESLEFRLFDFERMQLFKAIPESKRLSAVARLNHFPKLSRTDRVRFLDGYVHKYPDEARAFKEINGKILRLQEEQADRKTVRIAMDCVQDNRTFGQFATEKVSGYYRRPRADGEAAGIDVEEVVRMAGGSMDATKYRRVDTTHALYDWKTANVLVKEGGPVPLAVVVEAGREGGYVIYRK